MQRSLLYTLLTAALLLAGCSAAPESAAPPPTPDLALAQGMDVFRIHCASCHASQPDMTLVGPSLAGIASQAATRVVGEDAQTYISNSILHPADFIVPGYQNLMPNTFGKTLSGEDFDALVAYLLTLE